MLWVTHAAVGGALGTFMPNPEIAFAVGVFAHFVTDKIPHYWPESTDQVKKYMYFVSVITFTFFLLIIYKPPANFDKVLAAVFGSIIVDVLLVIAPLTNRSKLAKWHEARQPHRSNPVYLLNELFQIIIGLIIIYLAK